MITSDARIVEGRIVETGLLEERRTQAGGQASPMDRRRSEGDTITPSAFLSESMPDETTDITLYRLQACPYCERVVRTLDELGLSYRSRFIEPMHSERNVVKRVSGARTVPAIVDETTGVTMSESANIVEYLEATYGEGGA
jgi:glutaredoxin